MDKTQNFETVSLYVIGTELTRGIISDKHVALLSSELTKLGYTIKRAVIVPDDGTIAGSLKLSVRDSDVIIVTGGLGPTNDDMTRQIIADMAGVPLEKNKEAWDEVYARMGERIWGANESQTYIPKGFEKVPNPKGTAPGFRGFFEYQEGTDSKTVFIAAMPGPPVEMQHMFYTYNKPFLANLRGHKATERDSFSIYLTGESKLEEICEKCARPEWGVDWGDRFQPFKISLYISGENEEGRHLFEEELSKTIGKGLVERGEYDPVDLLTALLEEKGMKISTAESATCGLVSKLLTDRAGSSAWYWGGVASYANEAKRDLLGVDWDVLSDSSRGPVSHDCAIQMADGVRRVSGSDVALSITGIAGPSGAEGDKQVGTVYLGFSSAFRESVAVRLDMGHAVMRDGIRRRFATAALVLARHYILGEDIIDMASSWVYI